MPKLKSLSISGSCSGVRGEWSKRWTARLGSLKPCDMDEMVFNVMLLDKLKLAEVFSLRLDAQVLLDLFR